MQRIEDYLARLYRYAFSLAREEDIAKELVQQGVLKALAAKTIPDDEPAYRAWLFVIVRNTFLDYQRNNRRNDLLFEEEQDDMPDMEYWQGEDRLINVLNVRQALGKLRTADREVIGLVDMGGLSYAETSAVLDVPVGTVMSRISRARARLLALVEEKNVATFARPRGRNRKF